MDWRKWFLAQELLVNVQPTPRYPAKTAFAFGCLGAAILLQLGFWMMVLWR